MRVADILGPYSTACGFVWVDNEPTRVMLAVHTLSAPLLPGPPANELLNSTVNHTIITYPHLFAAVSPVNVDCLEELLASHPNRLPPIYAFPLRWFLQGFLALGCDLWC